MQPQHPKFPWSSISPSKDRRNGRLFVEDQYDQPPLTNSPKRNEIAPILSVGVKAKCICFRSNWRHGFSGWTQVNDISDGEKECMKGLSEKSISTTVIGDAGSRFFNSTLSVIALKISKTQR